MDSDKSRRLYLGSFLTLAENLAGTNPKDPHSYLRMTHISPSPTTGVQVKWGSVSNRLYCLQRTDGLGATDADFTTVAQHIAGTPPENAYSNAFAANTNT
jgi:hypothetical protein